MDKCVGPSVNFRGWDNRTVEIDSFVKMSVTWEGRKTMVERVATVKHPPFSVILGVDWIIASKTDLIIGDGIVLVHHGDNTREEKYGISAIP